jgi:hypothetical protein
MQAPDCNARRYFKWPINEFDGALTLEAAAEEYFVQVIIEAMHFCFIFSRSSASVLPLFFIAFCSDALSAAEMRSST